MSSSAKNSEKNNNQNAIPDVKDFLIIKSTTEQLKEGVERPVDTAYIEEEEGQLMLKAVFDVQHFKPNEIDIKVIDRQLVLMAQCIEDREEAEYKKTMSRKIDLPENVDPKAMRCEISEDKRLTVAMPFHLKPSDSPRGPNTVPIITEGGRRKIRLQIYIGPDFTMDDVKVRSEGSSLFVSAQYEAEVGAKGLQVTRRELNKEFRLPEHIEIDEVGYVLSPEGALLIEILLKDIEGGKSYKCSITTEDVTGKPLHLLK